MPVAAVVVGGGISGLAAAWELSKTVPGDEIVVVESADRLGGKIRTSTFAGRPVDEGADAFLARVPEAAALAREVGLGGDLISPATGQASLWIGGELKPIPAGHVLGVPTDIDTVARSGILTPEAVERARAEPDLPGEPLGPDDDVAVGDLVARRYGRAVQELLVDPLLGGINAGRSEELSIEIGAAQIAAAARRDASLTRALHAIRAENPPDPSAPVFYAPAGGMQRLTDSLSAALAARGVRFETGSSAGTIAPSAGGYEVVTARGAHSTARIVVTAPAWASAPLVREISPDVSAALEAIEYASVVVTTLAYRRSDLARPLSGSGFLVPRVEGRFLTAGSVFSNKWPALDDPELVIIRASCGRAGDDTAIGLDDQDLLDRVHAELAEALAIRGEPQHVRISRWPRAFPQFRPGHRRRMAEAGGRLARDAPGVALAGAHTGGVGIPACIASARAAVERVAPRSI